MPLDIETLKQMFDFEVSSREKKPPVLDELNVEGIVKKLKEFRASENSNYNTRICTRVNYNCLYKPIKYELGYELCMYLYCREESGGDDWSRDIHWWVNRGVCGGGYVMGEQGSM